MAMHEPARIIGPSEPSLRVFISGRIRRELEGVRDQAEASLRGLPFVRTWRFERTPPSSEELDESYLRHVRDADFLVWLADEDASTPVESEIAAGLDARVPILAFLLPAPRRSDRLSALITRVRDRVRTCTLEDRDALPEALALAIGDELIRALRGITSPGRKHLLLAAGLDSRARIVARLQAAGLPRDRALAFLDAPRPEPRLEPYLPTSGRPLRVLLADVGAGKTLLAERCLQGAIQNALDDPLAPVPLYARLDALQTGVVEWAESAAGGIGDPRTVGAFVVLDGADEPGARRPARILEEARALVSSFPATRALLTSRPLPTLAREEEVVAVQPLSDDDARALIARASGAEMTPGNFYGMDASLREAVRRPLFAIIYGALGSSADAPRLRTRGDIVRALVERVLRGREDLSAELERLAAIATGEELGGVAKARVGSYGDLQRALNSALLIEEGESVRFGLAIIREWFAAQHLLRTGEFEALLTDDVRRDLWRAAIPLAIGQAPPARANEMLAWLARRDPAFAVQVIGALEPRAARDLETPLGRPPRVYGEEVQLATAALAEGLDRLGRAVLPLDDAGRPLTIYVGVVGSRLLFAFPRQSEDAQVRELGPGELQDQLRWIRRGSSRIDARPGWAWTFVLDDARRTLREALTLGSLPVEQSDAYNREMAWLLASTLLQRGSLDPRLIPLGEIDLRSARLARGAWFQQRWVLIPCTPLLDAIEAARREGRTELAPPWPGPDLDWQRGGWVWSPYSPERLLERTRLVYRGALEAYRGLVTGLFLPVANRLWLWRVMPARLVGSLNPGVRDGGFEQGPALRYRFIPLSEPDPDQVDISLGPGEPFPVSDDDASALFRRRRPDATWLYASEVSTALNLFGHAPATKIAYSWLASDLSDIGLFSGAFFGPEW